MSEIDYAAQLIEHMNMVVEVKRQCGAGESLTYLGLDDLIRREGRPFQPRPLPSCYSRRTPNQCFKNAYDMLLEDQNLRYVEGIATSGVLPVHHAWNIDENDEVVETTWQWREDYRPQAYYGIVIPDDLVMTVVDATGYYGLTIDDWKNGWPAYRQPWNTNNLLHFYMMQIETEMRKQA